jgi:hypothetical protein
MELASSFEVAIAIAMNNVSPRIPHAPYYCKASLHENQCSSTLHDKVYCDMRDNVRRPYPHDT